MENSQAVARRAVLALLPLSFIEDNAEEAMALLNRARQLAMPKATLAGFRSDNGLDLLQMAVDFDAPRCVEILVKSRIFPLFDANPKAADILDTLLRLGADRKADRALAVILSEGADLKEPKQREAWSRAIGSLMADLASSPARHPRIEALAEHIPRALAVTVFHALPADRRAALPSLAARAGQGPARKKAETGR